jgi:hypothetical protein
VLNL